MSNSGSTAVIPTPAQQALAVTTTAFHAALAAVLLAAVNAGSGLAQTFLTNVAANGSAINVVTQAAAVEAVGALSLPNFQATATESVAKIGLEWLQQLDAIAQTAATSVAAG